MPDPIQSFVDQTQRTARKYHAKVSISTPGHKEVVIADERENPTEIEALENLIRNNFPRVQQAKVVAKEARAQLKDALLAKPDYKKADEEAKKSREVLKAAKARAMQDPQIYKLNEQAKTKTQEAKELQLSFSDWLVTYGDKTGVNQLDLGFGKPLTIKKSARLTK